MRFFIATLIVSLHFISAFGQTTNPAVSARISSLSGTYRAVSPCVECDSTITRLKLDCNPGCKSGHYTLTKINMHDMHRKVVVDSVGEWYVLPNKDSASNEDVLVIVLDMLGKLETYPLFMVRKDGSLFMLNQPTPERFPKSVVKLGGHLGITQKGAKPLSLEEAQKYHFPKHYTFFKQ